MKKLQRYLLTFVLVVAGAFVALFVYTKFFDKPEVVTIKESQPVKYAALPSDLEMQLPDLTYAAENSVHSVVHIMTQSVRGGWSGGNPILEFFGYQYRQEPQIAQGFGSGVIISDDGYIVTNNHVIEDAENIKVVLNDKKEYDARLVGTDPTTDVALLKIDAKDLPFITYGDSDELKLGEWVLAVGNPFNLTSTVTAGIVSARARNLNMSDDPSNIEAFIQTDAAVNPGNSGGALVNQRGQLVGINTVIASRTGSYVGYSFAVPVSIVKKVVADLKEFGEVQRALIGVTVSEINAVSAEQYNIDIVDGVYVTDVIEDGAAKEAGIKSGDIITSVDGKKINSGSELQETVSQYRPGDDVNVVVKRNNSEKQFTVTLRNKHGDTQIVRDNITVLGAQFEEVSNRDKQNLDISYGIKINKLSKGKLKDAGLNEGFIITNVNKKPIYEVNDFKREIGNARGGILVEGIYPNGETAYFVFGLS
ncbi:MAG: Do family serine endopeptidase [Prolixibacteraceae bacterium]|nr:Do family serine endopeptidase [Prolixibacteraceae bacterium]